MLASEGLRWCQSRVSPYGASQSLSVPNRAARPSRDRRTRSPALPRIPRRGTEVDNAQIICGVTQATLRHIELLARPPNGVRIQDLAPFGGARVVDVDGSHKILSLASRAMLRLPPRTKRTYSWPLRAGELSGRHSRTCRVEDRHRPQVTQRRVCAGPTAT